MKEQSSAHYQRWLVYMLASYSGTDFSGYAKHMDPVHLSVFKFRWKQVLFI